MPLNYDNTDLTWTFRGDFALGHNGDLADTYYDPLRSLYQEIRTRIQSDIGDWMLNPGIGASLSDFVGEPNSKNTAAALKVRLTSSLTKFGLINNSDIKVSFMPIDIDRILFRVTISVMATARNRSSTELVFTTIYNYSENNVSVS